MLLLLNNGDPLAPVLTDAVGISDSHEIRLNGKQVRLSGGNVYDPGDGRLYHRVTADGTVNTLGGTVDTEVLAVGGGGGGGSGPGSGGGGGGEVQTGTLQISGSTSITIGSGGNAGNGGTAATQGGSTTIGAITAIGGGRGGSQLATPQGGDGGSGGGGGYTSGAAGGTATGTGEGNNGGAAATGSAGRAGGGGGGAAAAGVTGSGYDGGDGGDGYLWIDGQRYGGGGGGGSRTDDGGSPTAGTGGLGGGGDGTINSTAAESGTANTGGGGGGAGYSGSYVLGGAGGSGVVVLGYNENTVTDTVGISDSHEIRLNGKQVRLSGGNVYDPGVDGRLYHRVTANGTVDVLDGPVDVGYAVIGGGGGYGGGLSGTYYVAGGGSGVVRTGTTTITSPVTVTIGSGGAGNNVQDGNPGTNGGTTSFGAVSATGGEAGGGDGAGQGGDNADFLGAPPPGGTASGGGAGASASASTINGGAGVTWDDGVTYAGGGFGRNGAGGNGTEGAGRDNYGGGGNGNGSDQAVAGAVLLAYNATTVTDPVGITDTVQTLLANPGSTDTVGITDTVVRTHDAARSITDAVGITDTLPVDYVETVTDPVGILDTVIEGEQNAESFTDPVGITDTATAVNTRLVDLPSIDGAIDVPGIGTLQLYSTTLDPVITFAASIDGASEPIGPFVVTATEAVEIAAGADVYAHLYNASGTLLSTLDGQVSVEWQDPQNEVGVGTLVLNRHDTDAALVTVGCQVRCFLYGRLVFAFLVEAPPEVQVFGEGDEAAEFLTVTGPGRNALAENGLVYSAKGIDDPLNPAHRLYSFASIDYVEGGGWVNAVQQYRADQLDPIRYLLREFTYQSTSGPDVVEFVPTPPPFDWPDPESWWIWGQADRLEVGFNFFRKWFNVPTDSTVKFTVTADNFYTLYLDGTPILGEKVEIACWREYKEVELVLPAGNYLLAAVVENAEWYLPDQNPSGLMVSAFIPKGTTGEPQTVLCRTDSTWQVLPYPATWPGWTVGQILIDVIAEAQARGELTTLTYDFSAASDSAGNAWPVTEGFSIPIGSSLLDVLDALVEEGWINYRLAPGSLVLQAFDADWHPDSGVTLQATGVEATTNLVSYDISAQTTPKTRLFVKWSGGHFQLDDAAAQATYGILPLYVSIDAATRNEADRRAQFILDNVKGPQDAISAGIAPTGTGDVPYDDFNIGDRLNVPNRTASGTTSERLLALSVSHDEEGNAIIGAELQTRIELLERLNEDLLQQLGTGRFGSSKVRWSLYQTEPVNS